MAITDIAKVLAAASGSQTNSEAIIAARLSSSCRAVGSEGYPSNHPE